MKKDRKGLINLIYTIPIVIASLLPMKKVDAQRVYPNHIPKPNAVFVDAQLGRLPIQGVGIGYSRKLTRNIASYAFLSGGRYRPAFAERNDPLNIYADYLKTSAGVMFYQNKENNHELNPFVSVGLSGNFYNKNHYIPGSFDKKAFPKISGEIGAGTTFVGNWDFGFQYDVVKHESRIFFGRRF